MKRPGMRAQYLDQYLKIIKSVDEKNDDTMLHKLLCFASKLYSHCSNRLWRQLEEDNDPGSEEVLTFGHVLIYFHVASSYYLVA